jgi:hypothetical protein
MHVLDFVLVDDGLYMADMSEVDGSGLWTIRLPESFYGNSPSEIFDCSIRDKNEDKNLPVKHLGSFETFRKANEYLNFLWRNGKAYDTLENREYVNAPESYEFALP